MLRDILKDCRKIKFGSKGLPVERTVAAEMAALAGSRMPFEISHNGSRHPSTVWCGVVGDRKEWARIHPDLVHVKQWGFVRGASGGGLEILSSDPEFMYGWWIWVKEEWNRLDAKALESGIIKTPTFASNRPQYDLFLTQHARTVRRFDPEAYVKDLARLGYTHVEVNGLAFPDPWEKGPPGELLHRFYTYCPALDQFVTSRLNKGTYPAAYLKANLKMLKRNAALAKTYGLKPGLACYEPRSVPETLFKKYPTLRGARVDHPFRSFKPRFNLSTGHPVVLEHYQELMTKLMKEVPELDYLAIYSNDSGAGFEYTHSLYAGRNGGGYVIREWRGEGEIAEAAAKNLVRYHKVLKDAARTVNPAFKVLLRFEAFWTEHEYVWKGLEEGLDVEVSSLRTKGWDLEYKHPVYPDVPQIHGTALFTHFDAKERPAMEALAQRGVNTHVLYSTGILWNHEPLLGIPFPKLVHEKLKNLSREQVSAVAHLGGATPISWAPYNVNQELVRAFQWQPDLDVDEWLREKAAAWAGPGQQAQKALEMWKSADDAYRHFPVPIWIYAAWNVWYRLAIRPIVPNIEAIPEKRREYYERHLLATFHNRARVDFRYDVGFDLVEPKQARLAVERMDRDLFPRLDRAVEIAHAMRRSQPHSPFWEDQHDRLRAWRCWMKTQRHVAAWVAGVHGYLNTKDQFVRRDCQALLKEMVLDEIRNTEDLLDLWKTSKTNWMIISEAGERTFIYDKNFGNHLKQKIKLMTGREDDLPHVDQDFQWRVPGLTTAKQVNQANQVSQVKKKSKKS